MHQAHGCADKWKSKYEYVGGEYSRWWFPFSSIVTYFLLCFPISLPSLSSPSSLFFCPYLFLCPGSRSSPLPWQSKVLVSVSVSSPDLFRVVLRYANWGSSAVRGRVSVIEESWNYYCGNCKCRTGYSGYCLKTACTRFWLFPLDEFKI